MTLIPNDRLRSINSPWISELCGRINDLEKRALTTVDLWTAPIEFTVGADALYVLDHVSDTSFSVHKHSFDTGAIQLSTTITVPAIESPQYRIIYSDGEVFIFRGLLTGCTGYVLAGDTLELLRELTHGDLIFTPTTQIAAIGNSLGYGVGSGGFTKYHRTINKANGSIAAEVEITSLERHIRPVTLVAPYGQSATYVTAGGSWFKFESPLCLRKLSGTPWPNTNGSSLEGFIGTASESPNAGEQIFPMRNYFASDGTDLYVVDRFTTGSNWVSRISTNATPEPSTADVLASYEFPPDQGQPGPPLGAFASLALGIHFAAGHVWVGGRIPGGEFEDVIVKLKPDDLTEVSRIYGNLGPAYEELTEWFRYRRGADKPENRENVGSYPSSSAWEKLDDDSRYILHGANIRDMRNALEAVCVYYRNSETDEHWTPPGSSSGANNIYQQSVDDEETDWWNHATYNPNDPSDNNMVKGWPGISFIEIEAIIKTLEASTTP